MITHVDELAVSTIRALSMDAVEAANSGHPGTPMALAPLGWILFRHLRRHDPLYPQWPDRDRFVLSAGHASMLQYALLHLSGYELSLDQIKKFRQWDSITPGHPEFGITPGVETTTGPLGQGIGNAVGMAIAERYLAARFNRPGHTLFDHCVYVIASDGDLMEGVSSEAASLAGHLNLGKLIVFWDDNRITIDGGTDLSFTEDVIARFRSYGWHTESVEDGNDMGALQEATLAAKDDARPSFIRVRTVIAYPAPTKQGTSAAHGAPLGKDEVAKTKEKMGWPAEAFFVPQELAAEREQVIASGQKAREEWNDRVSAYKRAYPDDAVALEQALSGKLPAGWDGELSKFDANPKGVATRKASGVILGELIKKIPNLVGGSADLAESNSVPLKGVADFRTTREGSIPRSVHWGVREHAMAAALNGMALHGGVIPFGATFLVFSDYMRPSIRLAALTHLPVRYVFTHDSIGLGEDGPTHQPVEHLASLRAIPGMTVLRPADANEVRECWKIALERKGPAALVLTRQDLPIVDRSQYGAVEGVRRGAYVLADAENPKAILIATGSEVALALKAQDALARENIFVRVVSMPSWELFAEQDAAYQESVLPSTIQVRVAIEAATRFGWERWVGNHGSFITLDHFGASAPASVLFEQFGFTPENIVRVVQQALSRTRATH